MIAYVVDACALIAYLFDEEGSDLFENLLVKARNNSIEMIMHVANLGEVYYDIVKRNDVVIAQETYQEVKQLPIRFEDRISDQMVYKIGDVKTTFRISYADAFAVAQAILSNAELITTDHKEFEPLEKAGILKIKWLR
jgi:predicted nucleic acid-binding protein